MTAALFASLLFDRQTLCMAGSLGKIIGRSALALTRPCGTCVGGSFRSAATAGCRSRRSGLRLRETRHFTLSRGGALLLAESDQTRCCLHGCEQSQSNQSQRDS